MEECELEAAEVLAGLSSSSAARGADASDPALQAVVSISLNPQVQTKANEHSTLMADQEKTNIFRQFNETLPSSHLCCTSYRSNHVGKSRSKLTEAEKEERRIRRILANRESARQAVRRRQAINLDLKGKAADVLEENMCLKKEKELALKECTSLKKRNEFLKAQIARIEKAKLGDTQAVSKTEMPSFATASTSTELSAHKQPCCVWPSIVPYYTDIVQLQHALSHSNSTSLGPSQLDFLHWDKKPCSHKGQEDDMCITTGQGIPVFVVPFPWLLPFLPHSSSDQVGSTIQRSNVQLHGSDFVKTVPGITCKDISSSGTRLFESVRSTRNLKGVGETTSNVVRRRSLLQKTKNQEPILCLEKKDATEVRRKRKELMEMKHMHFHRDKRSGATENKGPGFI